MIVQVAGKDSTRVQQILRAGTVVFHSFRYWWPPFDPDPRRPRRNPGEVSRRRPRAPLPRRRLRRSNPGIQRLAPAPLPQHHKRICRKSWQPAAKNRARPAQQTHLLASPHEFRRRIPPALPRIFLHPPRRPLLHRPNSAANCAPDPRSRAPCPTPLTRRNPRASSHLPNRLRLPSPKLELTRLVVMLSAPAGKSTQSPLPPPPTPQSKPPTAAS